MVVGGQDQVRNFKRITSRLIATVFLAGAARLTREHRNRAAAQHYIHIFEYINARYILSSHRTLIAICDSMCECLI